MTNLSPAAQAVLDAYNAGFIRPVAVHHKPRIAAALRAAVNQVIPADALYARSCCEFLGELNRKQLLAIADELEAQ
jgi:hypothetical protein